MKLEINPIEGYVLALQTYHHDPPVGHVEANVLKKKNLVFAHFVRLEVDQTVNFSTPSSILFYSYHISYLLSVEHQKVKWLKKDD